MLLYSYNLVVIVIVLLLFYNFSSILTIFLTKYLSGAQDFKDNYLDFLA